MVRPDVSCSGRYSPHLGDELRVVRTGLVEPEHDVRAAEAGRAATARRTQSRTGASFTWHARQTSPASTSCCSTTSPARFTTRTVPSTGISNVLSCEPYSSAFWAMSPTLGTEPIVAGSNAPWAWQSSTTAAYTPAYDESGMTALRVLQLAGRVPHLSRSRGSSAASTRR